MQKSEKKKIRNSAKKAWILERGPNLSPNLSSSVETWGKKNPIFIQSTANPDMIRSVHTSLFVKKRTPQNPNTSFLFKPFHTMSLKRERKWCWWTRKKEERKREYMKMRKERNEILGGKDLPFIPHRNAIPQVLCTNQGALLSDGGDLKWPSCPFYFI